MSRFFKSAAFPILIVVVLAFFARELISPGDTKKDPDYTAFLAQVENGRVKTVTLNTKNNKVDVETTRGDKYVTAYPDNTEQSLVNTLREQDITIDVKAKSGAGWVTALTYILPFVIFLLFWLFIINQMQGGGSKVMSFGKSRAKRMSVDAPKVPPTIGIGSPALTPAATLAPAAMGVAYAMLKGVTSRRLAFAAVAGQLAFVVAWVVAGALEPGYSAAEQAVSELAAGGARHPWILWLGLLSLSASDSAVAILLRRSLGPRGRLAAGMFAAAAAGVLLILVLPLDCMPSADASCSSRVDAGEASWRHYAHGFAAVGVQLTLVATPFAVARALSRRALVVWALGAGLLGLAMVVAFAAFEAGEPGYGIAQRATFGFVHLWVATIALGALSDAGRASAGPG